MVTALAYRIQDHYDHLMGLAGMVAALPPLPSTSDVDSEDEDEEAHGAQRPEADQALLNDFEADAFVLNQLLEIAMMHDYSDELGRRKMFTLIRESSRTCESSVKTRAGSDEGSIHQAT